VDDEMWDQWEQELMWLIGTQGGMNALGRALGISGATISNWLRRKRRPSPQHALALETFTNGKIKRETIRPDIYPPAVLMENRGSLEGFKRKPFATLDKNSDQA
jgi:DNA-binding transcriptional regulator YdaS (Cro superfamily)